MFRQIEKSDGAVIGSLVASGAQMNFKNMLSAVRTASGKNMDVRVDDGFGGLENLITKGKAIDAQINTGYQSTADNGTDSQNTDQSTQEKYYARLSGEIKEELADKTDYGALKSEEITGDTTIEQFADTIKMTRVSENSAEVAQAREDNHKEFHKDMQTVEQIDEQIIDALISYGQPISIDNIQAASMLLFERGSLFRQVIGKNPEATLDTEEIKDTANADTEQIESDVLNQADNFVEHMTDAGQASVSYQEIIREANKAVEHLIYDGANAQIDLKAAKALYKGLSLAKNIAREENYEIPMNIKGEITSVNLKIYHNASQTGKVAVTLDTERLGKVAAEFDVTKDCVSGMIGYENQSEKTTLKQLEQAIKQELGSNGTRQTQISVIHAKSVDLSKFGQDRSAGKASTGELYQTAKAFLTALKDI